MGINWVTGTFYKFNGGHKVEEGRYAVEGCHCVPLPPLQIQGENPTRTRDRVAITRDNSYLLIASGIKSLHTLWVALLRWATIYL